MTIIVFVGPTLSPKEASEILSAEYLPPARRGDVYRASLTRPRAIAVIDGYFDNVPSVWHKEILWAMSQGIHVFGAGSMGALRAAELLTFGMVGVGSVFEGYKNGELEDDDEVAVEHGPSETGYVSTDAMVNIRATVSAAVAAKIVSPKTSKRLVDIAKALFFKNRSYSRTIEIAVLDGVPASELDALRKWLPNDRVDQKKSDACAMLTFMKEWVATNPKPKSVMYTFEYTTKWDALVRHHSCACATSDDVSTSGEAPE